MLTALLASATLSFSCPALERGVSFPVGPGLRASLHQTGEDRFQIGVAGRRVMAQGECADGIEEVLVADFNFDGQRDLAIPTGIGYGGTNIFYDFYLYRPAAQTFVKARATGVGNPVPDPATRTVSALYKSGPTFTLATLCPSRAGDLYQCREGGVNIDGGIAQTDEDDDWSWYDERGRVVLSLPLRRSGQNRAIWTVRIARAALRPRPEAPVTRPSVVRGDRVEVLELRGGWARVRYTDQTGRVFAGWVRRSALRQP